MSKVRMIFGIVAALVLLPALSQPCRAQSNRAPFDPVVMETPWGQKVVPSLQRFAEMQIYEQLKPGQPWSAGDPIRAKILQDYREGRVNLRRYPWRVIDGIYCLGRDDSEQQIYLLDTGQGLLLIDPSFDAWQADIDGEIRLLGYDPSQVKWVLLTHCHIDHSQACHTWRDRGAKICVGDGDAHPVESGNDIVVTWLAPQELRHFTPTTVDQHVYDSDNLQFGNITLQAVGTPGHTPGSTCYYLYYHSKHILFSGDIAFHNGRYAWMGRPFTDWDQYQKSLQKLAHFEFRGKPVRFDILLPGHGTVDMEDGQRSVEETVKLAGVVAARIATGEKVGYISPYAWNWEQGVVYHKGN